MVSHICQNRADVGHPAMADGLDPKSSYKLARLLRMRVLFRFLWPGLRSRMFLAFLRGRALLNWMLYLRRGSLLLLDRMLHLLDRMLHLLDRTLHLRSRVLHLLDWTLHLRRRVLHLLDWTLHLRGGSLLGRSRP